MAKSSIHFDVVKPSSTSHNERKQQLDYVDPGRASLNESWKDAEILDKEKEIRRLCKVISGRKMQTNAEPIREAVINLESHHTMDDLKKVASKLQERIGVSCFQIHIHKDEGVYRTPEGQVITRAKNKWVGPGGKVVKNPEKEFPTAVWHCNNHAHMIFDWQDKKTGRTIKLGKMDLSQAQTIVAESLGMQRGELKVNSNRERLDPIEYKRQQEELLLQQVQEQREKEAAKIKALEAHGETISKRGDVVAKNKLGLVDGGKTAENAIAISAYAYKLERENQILKESIQPLKEEVTTLRKDLDQQRMSLHMLRQNVLGIYSRNKEVAKKAMEHLIKVVPGLSTVLRSRGQGNDKDLGIG